MSQSKKKAESPLNYRRLLAAPQAGPLLVSVPLTLKSRPAQRRGGRRANNRNSPFVALPLCGGREGWPRGGREVKGLMEGKELKEFFNEQFLTEYAQFVDEVGGGDGGGEGGYTLPGCRLPYLYSGKTPGDPHGRRQRASEIVLTFSEIVRYDG